MDISLGCALGEWHAGQQLSQYLPGTNLVGMCSHAVSALHFEHLPENRVLRQSADPSGRFGLAVSNRLRCRFIADRSRTGAAWPLLGSASERLSLV